MLQIFVLSKPFLIFLPHKRVRFLVFGTVLPPVEAGASICFLLKMCSFYSEENSRNSEEKIL